MRTGLGMMITLIVCLLPWKVQNAAAAEWEVKNADGSGGSCLIMSEKKPISDGYQEVTAQFVVDGKSFAIQSESVLDPSFNDIGLRVGNKQFVKGDRIINERRVVFDSEYQDLVNLFKAGLVATVQLRFWPEWPTKGPQSASFSLIGFTKAYDEAKCAH